VDIRRGEHVAVVVSREWINLRGVRLFSREGREIPEDADSHILTAIVLDARDDRGFWVQVNRGNKETNPSIPVQAMMIPWDAIRSIVLNENLSPALWKEVRQAGFVTGE
jgi:hypothetical protein